MACQKHRNVWHACLIYHVRRDILKIINDKLYRKLFFLNSITLQIIANILVGLFGVFHYKDNNLFVILLIPTLFIAGNILLLRQCLSERIFPSDFDYAKNHSLNIVLKIAIVTMFFVFFIFKSITLMMMMTLIQDLYYDNLIEFKSTNFVRITVFSIIIVFILFLHAYIYHAKLTSNKLKDSVKKISADFKLDTNTYFLIFEDKIQGFTNGHYSFCVYEGLSVSGRSYNPSIVLEYFNLTGIGFQELDEGHIKNIEMYAIGA
jgi:hypothetical protein